MVTRSEMPASGGGGRDLVHVCDYRCPYCFFLKQASPRGRLCAAGSRYFRIWPDGAVHRCCAATELGLRPLGHIRDRVVPVLPEPAPCPADRCFAPNEVSCLIER